MKRRPFAALVRTPIARVRASLARRRRRWIPAAILFIGWSAVALLGATFFVLGAPVLVLAAIVRRGPCPVRMLGAVG